MNTVPSRTRQGGFTLIEVLVSAMILSIGLYDLSQAGSFE